MPAISQSFRCFDEVARRGSVRKAAETLHLTAAAVNQQVLNLEAIVGMPLFDRLPRGMKLTSAGEIMVAAVRRSQRDFDNALAQVEDLRSLRRGHVSIGVSPSTAEYLLPEVIVDVQRDHPGLTFNVRAANGETLLRWLANGEIDVAYCLRRPAPPGVQEVKAVPQHLGLVAPPGHRLLEPGPRPLRLADCLDERLVLMSSDTELRAVLEGMDARTQRLGRPVVETTSVAMVRRLVAAGGAVSFLIPENVAAEVDAGTLAWRGLADPGARLQSCLYQRTGYTTPVAMGVVVQALQDAVARIGSRFGLTL